jgi:hypothetical protein
MLALRPNCECCDKDLPNGAADALICTFECTFCADCASTHFNGRCPNCTGDLVKRPTRPAAALAKYPASTERVRKPRKACA